jgi:YHS domain-containing protein
MKRMKWTLAALALIACIASAAPWPTGRIDSAPAAQTACPVMGFEIDREIFTDFKSKRIYFCCPACPPEFRKDPNSHMAEMKAAGVLLEDAPIKAS